MIEGHAINLETLYEITNGRNVIITRPFIEFIASFHYSIRVSRVAKALATFLIMNDRSIDLNLKSIVTEREIKKIKKYNLEEETCELGTLSQKQVSRNRKPR